MTRRADTNLPAGPFSFLEAGSGEPIVFLHALGRSAADWTAVMAGLADRWRCLALDQRGHGDSCRPGTYTFEELAADLEAFADRLGLDRFSLVGHSMGATAAWLFAQSGADRLDRLVIEDTAPPEAGQPIPQVPGVPPEPVDYDWEARRQLMGQLGSPDPAWWDNLPNVTVPTLIVSGGTNPDRLTATAAQLPDATVTAIASGHWIHETNPDRFIAVLSKFLADRQA